FYYHDQEKLVFGSRINCILSCPVSIKRSLNLEAVVDVVATSIIPTPKTIFREIQKLPPGHVLTCHRAKTTVASYWDINHLDPDRGSERELAAKLKSHVADAIAVRVGTNGGTRTGTFLSGGVDSSTVTGVLTQILKHPVKSFSIGFEEGPFNELDYARVAAHAFGAEHHEYFVSPDDTYTAIPLLVEAFDEPFANASAVPTYFCAKLARAHGVDVLFAGDGGDELFAGNERYATQRLFEYYERIPRWLRTLFVKPAVFTAADRLKWNIFVKGRKYIERASVAYPERLSSYGFFKEFAASELLDRELLETIGPQYDPYAPISFYYHHAPARSELDRQLYIDLKLAISDNDLFKVTRM